MLLSFDHSILLLVIHSLVSLQESHVSSWCSVLITARLVNLKEVLDQFFNTRFTIFTFSAFCAAQTFISQKHSWY